MPLLLTGMRYCQCVCKKCSDDVSKRFLLARLDVRCELRQVRLPQPAIEGPPSSCAPTGSGLLIRGFANLFRLLVNAGVVLLRPFVSIPFYTLRRAGHEQARLVERVRVPGPAFFQFANLSNSNRIMVNSKLMPSSSSLSLKPTRTEH